jgi:hypothetical protein
MSTTNHFSDSSTHSHGTSYTYGVSCGTCSTEGTANRRADRHGRARAAIEAEAIRATLQTLAAEIPLNDFTWLRLAVDAAFDELFFGGARD